MGGQGKEGSLSGCHAVIWLWVKAWARERERCRKSDGVGDSGEKTPLLDLAW